MHPDLPAIHGFVLKSYAFCCALAMFAALIPVRAEARRLDLGVEAMSWLTITSTLVGWVGAHALYMLTRLDLPADQWWELLPRIGSGNVWFGGLLLSWLFVYGHARRNGIPPLRMYDVGAFAILVAQAVGRIGCLLGGCCYGLPTTLPWGIMLDTREYGHLRVHPVPLYETFYLTLVFVWLWRTRRQHARPGHTAALYLAFCAGGRFMLEFLRGDRIRGFLWGWLSTSQFVALLLLGAAALIYARVANGSAGVAVAGPEVGRKPPVSA